MSHCSRVDRTQTRPGFETLVQSSDDNPRSISLARFCDVSDNQLNYLLNYRHIVDLASRCYRIQILLTIFLAQRPERKAACRSQEQRQRLPVATTSVRNKSPSGTTNCSIVPRPFFVLHPKGEINLVFNIINKINWTLWYSLLKTTPHTKQDKHKNGDKKPDIEIKF